MSTDRIITTHAIVPPFARGFVRDLRVRWALNEAGLDYRINGADYPTVQSDAFGARQPFHQMPCYSDGEVELFESGAIVLHIARQSEALMPTDTAAAARTTAWMFAALNSVEPWTAQLGDLEFFHKKKPWADARRPELVEMVVKRLHQIAASLGDKDWLEGRFSAGDLLMADVLRVLGKAWPLDGHPVIAAYVERATARPAFRDAMAGQMEMYGAPA